MTTTSHLTITEATIGGTLSQFLNENTGEYIEIRTPVITAWRFIPAAEPSFAATLEIHTAAQHYRFGGPAEMMAEAEEELNDITTDPTRNPATGMPL